LFWVYKYKLSQLPAIIGTLSINENYITHLTTRKIVNHVECMFPHILHMKSKRDTEETVKRNNEETLSAIIEF